MSPSVESLLDTGPDISWAVLRGLRTSGENQTGPPASVEPVSWEDGLSPTSPMTDNLSFTITDDCNLKNSNYTKYKPDVHLGGVFDPPPPTPAVYI